jgi:hypothetical protein
LRNIKQFRVLICEGVRYMKKQLLPLAVAIAVFSMSESQVVAGRFDPLFRVQHIQGQCTITAPGKAAEAAATDRAYPYGSHIKTGRSSSMILILSDGNEVQVLSNADLAMTEDVKDPKIKIIKLNEGKVEVNLEPEFNKENGLNVETPVAVCGAVACKFSVDSRTEEDLKVILFGCTEGKINLKGDHFAIEEMGPDNLYSLSSSLDREFLRLKVVKGGAIITVKDDAGAPQNIELKVGCLVKIWERRADVGNTRSVTIIITGPDGTKMTHAFNYNQADTRSPDDLRLIAEQIKKDKDSVQDVLNERKNEEDDMQPVVTTTTTTTTTVTTTTFPSPTPVGRR